MKNSLFFLALLLASLTNLFAGVWNYPQNGATVGNPTYFDCTAPDNPTYMKLWIYGSSTSIWTVHNTNHLVFVYLLANGTYTMDCQYNDGTTHDNYITITVGNNLYDAANVNEDPYNVGAPYWQWAPGCTNSGCSTPAYNSAIDPNEGDGESRYFSANFISGGEPYQDIYFYEKRCGGNAGINARAGHYMVNLNVMADATLPRGFEWGLSQWYNGVKYRMAFQDDYYHGVWNVYDPIAGSWDSTTITTAEAPLPTSEFKRLYLVGHPYTNMGERVAFDAIQIGECIAAPCADTDSDPVLPFPIPSTLNVGTSSEICSTGQGDSEGNSESLQLDLDSVSTSGKVWTDAYYVHLQP